jgi:hypothetical protein
VFDLAAAHKSGRDTFYFSSCTQRSGIRAVLQQAGWMMVCEKVRLVIAVHARLAAASYASLTHMMLICPTALTLLPLQANQAC